MYADEKSKQQVKDLVRKKIVPQLREKLAKVGAVLVAEHGKDIQHAPGSGPASGTATPTYTSSSSSAMQGERAGTATPTSGTASTQGGTKGPLVNVTTVTDTEEFHTTAQELFQ